LTIVKHWTDNMRWVGSVKYAEKTLISENMNEEITAGIALRIINECVGGEVKNEYNVNNQMA
jgi:hypothetical protein